MIGVLLQEGVDAVPRGVVDEIPFTAGKIPVPELLLDTRRAIAGEKALNKG
jgi:hypothetical protein